jgi:hypothetical protein
MRNTLRELDKNQLLDLAISSVEGDWTVKYTP